MKRHYLIRRVASIAAVLLLMNLNMTSVFASIVDNDALVQQTQRVLNENRVLTMLERDIVIEKLNSMGVDLASARSRVSHLADAELARLVQDMDQLPAGSGVAGIALTVFVVLVITDMLGATDVFPFVKKLD